MRRIVLKSPCWEVEKVNSNGTITFSARGSGSVRSVTVSLASVVARALENGILVDCGAGPEEPNGGILSLAVASDFDMREQCIVSGCGEKAVAWWPLLPHAPAFCHKHIGKAESYGADLSGPDDFEIPVD